MRQVRKQQISQFTSAAHTVTWRLVPNRWDFIAFPLILCTIAIIAVGFHQSFLSNTVSTSTEHILLNWHLLPNYALHTMLRMLIAIFIALIFSITYGTFAAKNKHAEKILVPILDILQSVPVLGYMSITVTFFLSLVPGKLVGAECAAIFAIFTSQVWNMTFSFYQSLRTVPHDLNEVANSFHLTCWQKFWKLEVPFAMPGLIWNMMMSMSGGWFFVVASEVIKIGNNTIILPGIGSYLSIAIDCCNLSAIIMVIITMSIVILLYDQLMFRPLVVWSNKFQLNNTTSQYLPKSWFLKLIQHTRLIRRLFLPIGLLLTNLANLHVNILPFTNLYYSAINTKLYWIKKIYKGLIKLIIITITFFIVWQVVSFISHDISWNNIKYVLLLGLITFLRIIILIVIVSLIWVPIGVLVGLHPVIAEKIQFLAQFLAAFPANLFFPVFVLIIVKYNLNPDIWLSLLIMLGAQWYILFNVIAGTIAYPNEFREVSAIFSINGLQWWFKVIIPGIFPYYITGAITAFGSAWNVSIVAEAVSWGKINIFAHGLGAYIAYNTTIGNYPKIILGLFVMVIFVTLFNRLFWRPLYTWTAIHFKHE